MTQEFVAENLLGGLWRCIYEEYKERYKKEIWEHFENALRSASYTDSLKIFLNNFQKRIPVDLQVKYTKDMLLVVESGQDEQILNWFRTETTYLIMLVRIRNQERKETLNT
jgi:hypothetical protein